MFYGVCNTMTTSPLLNIQFLPEKASNSSHWQFCLAKTLSFSNYFYWAILFLQEPSAPTKRNGPFSDLPHAGSLTTLALAVLCLGSGTAVLTLPLPNQCSPGQSLSFLPGLPDHLPTCVIHKQAKIISAHVPDTVVGAGDWGYCSEKKTRQKSVS